MKLTNSRELGLVLRERRRELGLSQQQFAELVGVPRLWIAKMETGRGNPTFDRLVEVLERAGMSFQVMFTPKPAVVDLDEHLAQFGGTVRRNAHT
jgi:transcriptional regulator with XRE-family HTH domain